VLLPVAFSAMFGIVRELSFSPDLDSTSVAAAMRVSTCDDKLLACSEILTESIEPCCSSKCTRADSSLTFCGCLCMRIFE